MLNQLKVAQSYRISGGIFNDNILDTTYYTARTSAGGSVSVSNTEAIVTLTTTSNSRSGIYANSLGRYIGSNMNYYRSVHRMGDMGAANNVRRFGVCDVVPAVGTTDINDGFYFKMAGTTVQIAYLKGGVETAINSGSWNGNGTLSGQGFTMDTNYHTYEIYYTSKKVLFVIDSEPKHTLTATTSSFANTRHFHPFMDSTNTGVGTAVNCYAMVMTISRYGTPMSQAKSFLQQATTTGVILKVGPGSIHSLNISGVQDTSNISLYDDSLATGGTGPLIYTTGIQGKTTLPFYVPLDGDGGVQFDVGLRLVISGAASNVLVKFE